MVIAGRGIEPRPRFLPAARGAGIDERQGGHGPRAVPLGTAPRLLRGLGPLPDPRHRHQFRLPPRADRNRPFQESAFDLATLPAIALAFTVQKAWSQWVGGGAILPLKIADVIALEATLR